MERTVGGLTLECIKGDLTAQPDIGIIVNAANKQLKGGGGVDGAINRAAGPELVEASRSLGPIEAGEAVITPGFELPNDHVIHCVGPVYSASHPVAEQLARCYREAMRLAAESDAASIAFPAISCGVYGYPLAEAGEIAVRTVADCARDSCCFPTTCWTRLPRSWKSSLSRNVGQERVRSWSSARRMQTAQTPSSLPTATVLVIARLWATSRHLQPRSGPTPGTDCCDKALIREPISPWRRSRI